MAINIGTIGFGTTSLLALGSERECHNLLHAAFEAGATHFDTAPYYGYGEAEKILGRFIKERRGQVTVATKFGIQPPRLAGGGSVAGAVKRLVKRLGPVRKLLARQAGRMVRRGAFSVADAERSLESSLRSLQTDHIDIYLLHEASLDEASDELLDFLRAKQRQGVVVRFGIGSDFRRIREMPSAKPEFAGVLQFENSVTRPNLQTLSCLPRETQVITHGALGDSFRRLREVLAKDSKLRREMSELLGADAGLSHVLAAAMLAWAAQDNAGGIVLFSSSRAENARANISSLRAGSLMPAQLAEFGRLANSSAVDIKREVRE